jgi:hypothetical protein
MGTSKHLMVIAMSTKDGHMRKEYNTSMLTQFNVPPKPHDADLIMPWDEAEAGAQELLSHPEQQALNVGHAQQDVLDVIK